MLPTDAPWALVARSVTDMRREPGIFFERVSQALLGEAVRILEPRGEWAFVSLERDSYQGWIQTAALLPRAEPEIRAYQASCNALVSAMLLPAFLTPHPYPPSPLSPLPVLREGKGGQEARGEGAAWLPFGAGVAVEAEREGMAALRLPDGRLVWVAAAGLLPLERRPRPDLQGIAFTLELIQRFIGVPYLWGGRTPFGYDCSGLAGAFAAFLGVSLPRDADPQFRTCRRVEGAPLPGDLLFFGEPVEGTPSSFGLSSQEVAVSHVAISLGNDEMIHANGAAWGVSYNSMDPDNPRYRAWLREHLVGTGRFYG